MNPSYLYTFIYIYLSEILPVQVSNYLFIYSSNFVSPNLYKYQSFHMSFNTFLFHYTINNFSFPHLYCIYSIKI